MTKLRELQDAIDGFDPDLDVKIRLHPIHPDETIDGHEAGDIVVKQETVISVTYYYPLVRRVKNDAKQTSRNRERT